MTMVKSCIRQPCKTFSNLSWYIQYLIDESGYESDDDDNFDHPLSENYQMLQTNWKFIKHIIHSRHSMTPQQLKKKNPTIPIIKVNHHQKP